MAELKYLLIEDEIPAARRLQHMISEIAPDFTLLETLSSVEASTAWFSNNPAPDCCIMDIELADGHSFEIFNRVKVECPVIFTTAFDEFAVKAFRLNSIDYLLKPIKKEELTVALERVREKHSGSKNALPDLSKLLDNVSLKKEYQKRMLIRYGDNIKAIEIADAAYFYTENRINYMVGFNKASYPVDMNLDQLEKVLDPSLFFRINRQFIIHVKSIRKMTSWSKSRLKLDLEPECPLETVVSTERTADFKVWITGSPHTL